MDPWLSTSILPADPTSRIATWTRAWCNLTAIRDTRQSGTSTIWSIAYGPKPRSGTTIRDTRDPGHPLFDRGPPDGTIRDTHYLTGNRLIAISGGADRSKFGLTAAPRDVIRQTRNPGHPLFDQESPDRNSRRQSRWMTGRLRRR